MAISNTQVRTDLVALSGQLAASGDYHDDLNGITALAGNEVEGEIADVIQQLSFTTHIKDICDELKQDKELDEGTPEYNENTKNIKENIQEINNLGYQMGFKKEVIPTPSNGKEAITAANAVYSTVALPYEAGADVDYAKYITMQEGKNPIARAMKSLSAQVAKSPQEGTHAKNFWKSQVKAANNNNALAYAFLDGMDSLNKYSDQLSEMKDYLNKQEKEAASGVSTQFMGDYDKGDKIDFEGDDKGLQADLKNAITKADKIITTERKMLRAGHIDKDRRKMFESTMKGYMKDIKHKKKAIENDNVRDMEATAALEEQMATKPDGVNPEHEKKYLEMVDKQKHMAPNFTLDNMKSCAGLVKLGIDAMNIELIASGVTPISTSLKPLDMLKVGKFAYDANNFIKNESNKEKDLGMEPTYNGSKVAKAKAEKEEETQSEPETEPKNSKVLLAIQRTAEGIRDRLRRAAINFMAPMDENDPEYSANEAFKENIEVLTGDILDKDGNVISGNTEADMTNKRQKMTAYDSAMACGTGEHPFAKDPQEMSDEELNVNVEGLRAVMAPMKDKNGKYFPNFSDCHGIGEEEMTDFQKENSSNMIMLMTAGQPEAAIALREAQTNLIGIGQQQNELASEDDLTHVEDNTAKYEKTNEDANKELDKMQKIKDTYKPLCKKLGLMAASSLYKKHEYNKEWRETVREFNTAQVCQGTIQAMEESKRESERLNNERLYGPHGLLRA